MVYVCGGQNARKKKGKGNVWREKKKGKELEITI